jgi:hypothetical protein
VIGGMAVVLIKPYAWILYAAILKIKLILFTKLIFLKSKYRRRKVAETRKIFELPFPVEQDNMAWIY